MKVAWLVTWSGPREVMFSVGTGDIVPVASKAERLKSIPKRKSHGDWMRHAMRHKRRLRRELQSFLKGVVRRSIQSCLLNETCYWTQDESHVFKT